MTKLGEQHLEQSKQSRNELDNIKSETLFISKDTKDLKYDLTKS